MNPDLTVVALAKHRVKFSPETPRGFLWVTKYGETFENCTPYMAAFFPWKHGLSTRLPDGSVVHG